MRTGRLCLGLATVLALAGCAQPQGADKVDGAYLASGGDGADWPAVGYSYAEQRFSPLDQINADTVGRLGIAWYADLPDPRGQEATPVVVDGILYVTGPWSKLFAYRAATGEALWTFDPGIARAKGVEACCDVVNRGVALWKGRLYIGALDGRLIALDAATGKTLWSVQTTDPAKPYTITGAPRVVKGMVIIGNGGAEFGVRGYVTAYDAATGAKKWRFYTVPNPTGAADGEASDAILKTAARSWSAGGQWKESGGGGTVWDAIVYDAELDQLYIGVGNGSPWNHGLRSEGEGDNLFLSSIVALKPETGEYLWHYQETPAESWDYTATQPIVLATMVLGGAERKLLFHAPKNGFFFAIDRTSGKLVSADPFVANVNWASGYDPASGRPIENPAARYYRTGKPFLSGIAPIGAHSWQPMAFSPKTGLVYIPANEIGFAYLPPLAPEDAARGPIGFNVGANMAEGGLPGDVNVIKAAIAATRGKLVAWDPVKRTARWTLDFPTPWNGGLMATAGNLLFGGTASGEFSAWAADSGKRLWTLPVQSGVMAAPSTFTVDGVQYVAFTTGRGGVWPLSAGLAGMPTAQLPDLPRLIVLKLDGKGRLPAPPAVAAAPLAPPAATGSARQLAAGKALFGRYCMVCHGAEAAGGGVTPDLRRSAVLADAAAWRAIVVDGALAERGMVGFARVLDSAGAESLRHYVVDRAQWMKANGALLAPAQ